MSWPERLANVPNERWHKNLNLGRMKCRVIQFVKEFIYTVCIFFGVGRSQACLQRVI